jgi:hypothetical protein
MDQEGRDSGIADLRLLLGVKDANKGLRMDQDHQDVSSRTDPRLSVLPQLLSKIINGAPKCDPMLLLWLQDRKFHLAMVARLLHPQPLEALFLLVAAQD